MTRALRQLGQNTVKQDPVKAVARRKRWSRSLLLEYGELLSQRGVLDREMHPAMNAGDECAEQGEEGANHARRLGQPDDTGKSQFLRDIKVFGVMASHSLSSPTSSATRHRALRPFSDPRLSGQIPAFLSGQQQTGALRRTYDH